MQFVGPLYSLLSLIHLTSWPGLPISSLSYLPLFRIL